MIVAFALWLYGVLVLSSIVMILAWGSASLDMRRDARDRGVKLRWCKAFIVASGLTVNSLFMLISCAYRGYDIVVNHSSAFGSEVLLQIAILMGFAYSKMLFVWAASIEEEIRHLRWPWFAYLYAMMLWGLFVMQIMDRLGGV